jgi:ATP sulfurylase
MFKTIEHSKPHVKKLQARDDAAIAGKLSKSGLSKTPDFSRYYQEGSNYKRSLIVTSPHGLDSRGLVESHFN